MLLLSWNLGALPSFLPPSRSSGDGMRATKLAYLADAVSGFAERPAWADEERSRLSVLGYELVDVTAVDATLTGFSEALRGVDGVYVAGGNTFALLAALRSSGTDVVLRDRVQGGLPYIGLSAGAVLAGPSVEPITPMDDPTEAPPLRDLRGLGLVDAVPIPHADGQLAHIPESTIIEIVADYHDQHELLLLGDDEAATLVDDLLVRVASPRIRPAEPAAPSPFSLGSSGSTSAGDGVAAEPAPTQAARPQIDTAPLRGPVSGAEQRAFRAAYPNARRGGTAFRRALLVVGAVVVPLGMLAMAYGMAQEVADANADMVGELIAMGAIVGLFVVGGAVLTWAAARLRSRVRPLRELVRLWRFALANGMQFLPGSLPTSGLGPIAERGRLVVSDAMQTTAGHPVLFGNFHVTAQDTGRRLSAYGGLAASRAGTRLPHLRLESRRSRRILAQTATRRDQRLSLEGDFDTHFDLYCPVGYERDALYLLTPDVMALLMDHAADYDVELVDDWVYLTTPRDVVTLDADRWTSVTAAMGAVLAKIGQWERWRDDRVPENRLADPGSVADGGRRLRVSVGGGALVAFFLVCLFGAATALANVIR